MKRKLGSLNTAAMTTFQLDHRERQLKRLLLDAAAWIDNNRETHRLSIPSWSRDINADPARHEKVVLRWAGGWVRDKLLGQQSHDIDVAINCMTGENFGEALKLFCRAPDVREKHGLQKRDIGNIHTIAKNPEKSKNLETATVQMFGLDVDLVNLRTETYVADSRNPLVEFGTAEEDALRRDATVNALFYNIHTDEVEDFVGGLEDIQAKVMRTPLDPFQTFMDDPLRVLRLVRFASRLEFTIDPKVKEFMGNEEVLKALRVKISRERVGVEIDKMLKGECLLVFAEYHPAAHFLVIFTSVTNMDRVRTAPTRRNPLHSRTRTIPHRLHRPHKPRSAQTRPDHMGHYLRVHEHPSPSQDLRLACHVGRGAISGMDNDLPCTFRTDPKPRRAYSQRQEEPSFDNAGGARGTQVPRQGL